VAHALRRSGIRRRTPLRPSAKPLARSPIRRQSSRARARSRTWAAVCRAVFAACGGRCQVGAPGCTGKAGQGHHRQPRAQGGRDVPGNCLPVCLSCHVWLHCHPSESYARGFLIRRNGGAA